MFGIWDTANLRQVARWHVLVPDFEISTDSFYDRVRALIEEKRIPDLRIDEIVFREGGPLSSGRRYLRLRRERIVFDFCSAPFGTSWFFSCRFGVIPMFLLWWEALVILALAAGVAALHVLFLGWTWGTLMFLMNAASLLFLLNGLVATGLYGLDAVLLRIPVLGAFYECCLRGDSYYRDDTRRMYRAGIDQLLRDAVDEVTSSMPEGKVIFEEEPAPAGIRLWDRIRKGLRFPWATASDQHN